MFITISHVILLALNTMNGITIAKLVMENAIPAQEMMPSTVSLATGLFTSSMKDALAALKYEATVFS